MDRAGLVFARTRGHNPGLERGDRLTIQNFALNPILRKQGLLRFARGRAVTAPSLEPAGLAQASGSARPHNPIPVQLQRRLDQAL